MEWPHLFVKRKNKPGFYIVDDEFFRQDIVPSSG